MHAAAPAKLYCPSPQGTAVPFGDPAGHINPAVQLAVQLPGDVSPAALLNFPAGQGPEHNAVTSPVALPKRPAGHGVHPAAPGPLYCPAWHSTAVALVDPAGHACPAAQSPVHVGRATPEVLPNDPPGHGVHPAAPGPLYWPAGHSTAVALVDPAGQAYPAVQLPLHTDVAPAAELNVPAGHAEHDAAPASLYCPAGHCTAVALVEPTGHAYPGLQVPLHPTEALTAPITAPNVPPAHAVHDGIWPTKLYCPGGHGVHAATASCSAPGGHPGFWCQTTKLPEVTPPTTTSVLPSRLTSAANTVYWLLPPLAIVNAVHVCGDPPLFRYHITRKGLASDAVNTSTRPSPSASAARNAVGLLTPVAMLNIVQEITGPPLLRCHATLRSVALTDSTSTLPSLSTSAACTNRGPSVALEMTNDVHVMLGPPPPPLRCHVTVLLLGLTDNTSG